VTEDFDIDVDDDGGDKLGFEPVVSATGAEAAGAKPRAVKHAPRRSLSRRLGGGLVLVSALVALGGSYEAFAASSGAPDNSGSAADISAGSQLYQNTCITCHGANLQGVKGRGPSLYEVGGASVYFQVSTGRMPASGQGADVPRKASKFTEQQTKQLAAYIESIGGGPTLPAVVRGGDTAVGGDLFALTCAQCHGRTFKGAPLSAGKIAPSLNKATDAQIYAAMLSGPESMPIFSDNDLTPKQKQEIVNYIQTLKASKDPGGNGIDRIGPVSEALVFFVGGVGAVMIAILWIGAKSE
jgi:ubiquinol-cytochrome c reductase cytochrome c subunit